MITRPNKVFFISKEFNFIQSTNDLASYASNMLKAMVSGFGPYPIISVKVTSKVATVDIGEVVRLYPGVKISIAGTGVTDLDTWHEVDKIDNRTFTFNVDVPDGNYTNGITMSYPSLGWSLADRTSNKYLFKSGTSSSISRYTLISVDDGYNLTGSTDMWRRIIKVEQVECDGTIDTIYSRLPVRTNIGMRYMSSIEYNATANFSFWCFYGDDSFAMHAHKEYWPGGTNTLRANTANPCMMFFGEIAKSPFKNGSYFINGEAPVNRIYTVINTINNQSYHLCGFGGLAAGTAKATDGLIALGNNNERYSFQLDVLTLADFATRNERSGNTLASSFAANFTGNKYGAIYVTTANDDCVGYVPGFYYVNQQPNMTAQFTYSFGGVPIDSFLKPVVMLGDLKGRKTYAFYSNGYNSYEAGIWSSSQYDIYPLWQSVAILDLSGPIR